MHLSYRPSVSSLYRKVCVKTARPEKAYFERNAIAF